MIEIKVNDKGKEIEVTAMVEIVGYGNATEQFFAVINALDKTSEDVLADALEMYMKSKLEGDDNDESES